MIRDAKFPPSLKIKTIDNDSDTSWNVMSWLHFFCSCQRVTVCYRFSFTDRLLLVTRSLQGLLNWRQPFFFFNTLWIYTVEGTQTGNKIGICWLELENKVKTGLRNKAEGSLLEVRGSSTDVSLGFSNAKPGSLTSPEKGCQGALAVRKEQRISL